MKFSFKARNEAGEIREGIVEAPDSSGAIQVLQRNALIPINVREQAESGLGFAKNLGKILNGVNQKELMVFFQQLSTLIEARVPIVSSLRTIGDQTLNNYFSIIVKEMADDVEDGMPFSEALDKQPDVFDPLTVNMIRAGEISGSMQKSLTFVAENIEKNYQLAAKIKGALYYPVFVLLVAFIIGFLVVTFILPKITLLIKDLKVAVPWYTTALIVLGDFMAAYWWAVLLLVIAAVSGMYYYIRTPAGQREWQIVVLKIPVIGRLAKNIYITRMSENLSALLNSGIPVVRSLIIVSEVVGNQVFERILLKAVEEVKAGGNMSTVFLNTAEIPPIVSQMIKIGEETGSLANVLENIAKFYNQEVDIMTKSLTTLIEPLLIVFLGIGVGILVVGVLLPIYNLAGQL